MYLLITGATGHIGSCLAKSCDDKKIKTVLLTRFKKKKKLLKKKFKSLLVLTDKQLSKTKYNISTIIHTASLNDKATNSDKNSLSKNLNITSNLLKDIKIKNLKKIIYLSSAQVYGSSLIKNVKETKKLVPINNYGVSRLLNELYLKRFAKKYNKNLIILRISNVIGEPEIINKDCLRLLPNDLKNQSLTSGKLKLRSSGLQFRNFLSMNFLIKTILILSKKKVKGLKVFNLGGVNIRIISFVKLFAEIFKKKKKKNLNIKISSNLPSFSEKLNFDDNKVRKFLNIKKRETINSIIENFL